MFKTITLCENFFETGIVYPNRVGVNWGSPTPLVLARNFVFDYDLHRR